MPDAKLDDEMRPEYNLSELKNRIRGQHYICSRASSEREPDLEVLSLKARDKVVTGKILGELAKIESDPEDTEQPAHARRS